jgi:predicted PurR-regulated permease PerM
MNETLKFPFYARLSFVLISLIAIWVILYYGQNIITPVLLAILFSILLGPVKTFFEKKLRFPHVIASLTAVVLFVAFFAAIIFFLSWQIGDMMSDWGKIKTNLNYHVENLQELIKTNFNLSKREQKEFIDSTASDNGKQIISSTLMSVSDTLLNLVLVLIYTFLLLIYRAHFIKFMCKLWGKEHHAKLQEILIQVKVSVQSYIVGLFIEMIIVSALTSIGFMIIGLEYAFLLGAITGLLNLIPYIGILGAGILSIVASLSGSPDLSIVVGVIVVNIIVQFIDNNFLVPMIVSSKVEINALVSIVGIIAGGALAGFAGMFLAIPFLAIGKVIFDRVEDLSPWGYLMGDDMPKTFRWHKLSLPLFHHETASATITIENPETGEQQQVAPTVLFTETKTIPTPETQDEAKPEDPKP